MHESLHGHKSLIIMYDSSCKGKGQLLRGYLSDEMDVIEIDMQWYFQYGTDF